MDDLLSEKEQIEKMRTWWSDYGYYVIGGIALGAIALFAINYYQSSLREAQHQASALYDTLADHIVDARVEAAESVAGQLATDFADSPYAAQSQLALARLYMDQNRDQDAADTLRVLLAGGSDDVFKQVARVRLAKVLLYQDRADEAVELLDVEHSDAFGARYAEVIGDAYVKLSRFDDAREAYQRALGDPNQSNTIDQSFVQLKLLDLPIGTFSEAPDADEEIEADPAAEDGEVDPAAEIDAEVDAEIDAEADAELDEEIG